MLRIGNLSLDAPFFLAPLSGYSDAPMRLLCRRFGSPLGMSGLLMDKMILHAGGVSQPIAALLPDEHPVGAQLLGDDPETMAQAAQKLHQAGYDLIDMNFSCPAPKVLRTRRGGFLMSQPEKILEIAQRVRDAVPCPVTMKLRIGYKAEEESFEQFRRVCRQAKPIGIDALIIHGRTVDQRFHGRADWDVPAAVKKELPDTVIIGSGDLTTVEFAVEKIRFGGVDGVAIARGAIGNPWFFSQLRAAWANAPVPPLPGPAELTAVMAEHFEMLKAIFGDHKAVINFRKFLANYCKKHPHRKKMLLELMHCKTGGELIKNIHYWGDAATINDHSDRQSI